MSARFHVIDFVFLKRIGSYQALSVCLKYAVLFSQIQYQQHQVSLKIKSREKAKNHNTASANKTHALYCIRGTEILLHIKLISLILPEHLPCIYLS